MSTQSIIDTRRYQMFPKLEPEEIKRVRRFGEVRSYDMGEALAKVGEVGHGLTVVLAGTVNITQHDEFGAPRANRHPWTRLVYGRTGSAGGPAGSGGRLRARTSGGRDHPAGAAPGAACGGGGTRRADHARLNLASRRPARDGSRRPGYSWPCRERRCDSARRLSLTQWASASEAQPRYRSRGEGAGRTLPGRPRSVADCTLPGWTIAAQS